MTTMPPPHPVPRITLQYALGKQMIDPQLAKILVTTLSFGASGSLVAGTLRAWHLWRHKEVGPGIGQAAAIGFLLGAAWGAFHAIFQSMVS